MNVGGRKRSFDILDFAGSESHKEQSFDEVYTHNFLQLTLSVLYEKSMSTGFFCDEFLVR